MESINVRLKDMRYTSSPHLTIKQVADMTGIPASTIADYEQEGMMVPSDAIIRYAKTFNVSADYLLGLTDMREVPDAELRDLHLSETAVMKLKQERMYPWLLSSIIEHELFDDLMIDAELYISGYVDEVIQSFNTSLEIKRILEKNKRSKGTNTENLVDKFADRHCEVARLDQDLYFSQLVQERLKTMLTDIRVAHYSYPNTSDYKIGQSIIDAYLDSIKKHASDPTTGVFEGVGRILKIKPLRKNTMLSEKLARIVESEEMKDWIDQSELIEPNRRRRRNKKWNNSIEV